MTSSPYRPEIDGIRAIAVLAVLLFHLGVPGFSGGFAGVDVFFVISGFLITRLIYSEVDRTGRFNFSRFYVRRMRRLFPAAFVTFLAAAVAGGILFPPQLLSDLAGSIVWAILSVSNIYFWLNTGYFDTAATLKPLLHTWSLGVEEQFYFVWPLLLVASLAFGRRIRIPVAPIVLLVVSVVSLALNFIFVGGKEGQSTIYYLLPFRIFELGIGGLTVWIGKRWPADGHFREVIALAGLVLIGATIVGFTKAALWPYYNALAPCVGTAFLIYSNQPRAIGLLLRNPVSLWIGKASYSLYLIHWPLIVFASFYLDAPLSPLHQGLIGALAIAISFAMYFGIEQRFRYELPNRRSISRPAFAAACGLLALPVVLISATAWRTGWTWRYPDKIGEQLGLSKNLDYKEYVFRQFNRHKQFANNGKFKVLVIGDSMAGNVVNLFGESGIVDEIDLATQHTSYLCQPVLPADPLTFAKVAPPESYCGILAESVKRSDKLPAADVIVLAGFWQGWAIELIPETIRFLRTVSSARVAVIGVKQSNSGGLQFLAENARNPNLRSYMIRYDQWVLDANRRMEALSKAEGAEFYDLHALYCNSVGCPFMTPNGDIIVYDHAHYTQAGAAWIATRIRAEWSIRLFHPKGPSEPAMRVEFPPAPVVR